MVTSYTPNVKLAQPAFSDTGWSVPLNANTALLDGLTPIGSLAVTLTEVPSASLNVRVAAGNYLRQDGTIARYVGSPSTGMPSTATNYLYLDLTSGGALTVNNTGFPTTAHVRLAVVVSSSSTITSIADNRIAFGVLGSIVDGVNWTFGSATGTQIGTATTQKIGFFGTTPTVQPRMGAATAGAAYTSNEQAMLQAVYNAIRSLGLGS
jgi:hypothetical protein